MLYKDPTGHEGAKELLLAEGNPYAVVGVDDTGDLGIDMGLSGVPESFLIDANGQIIKTKRNYFVEQDVVDFVAAYKAEVAKAQSGRELAASAACARLSSRPFSRRWLLPSACGARQGRRLSSRPARPVRSRCARGRRLR